MPHSSLGYSILLVLGMAVGCGPRGSDESSEPAPQSSTTELTGKVFVTGSEPSTGVTLVQEGGGVTLIGALDAELRRLSGATLRVQGARSAEPAPGGFEVWSYDVLSIDGETPEVGMLQEKGGGLWLAGRDTVSLTPDLDALRGQAGAKVWIVGRRGEGTIDVQSFGIIREAGR